MRHRRPATRATGDLVVSTTSIANRISARRNNFTDGHAERSGHGQGEDACGPKKWAWHQGALAEGGLSTRKPSGRVLNRAEGRIGGNRWPPRSCGLPPRH